MSMFLTLHIGADPIAFVVGTSHVRVSHFTHWGGSNHSSTWRTGADPIIVHRLDFLEVICFHMMRVRPITASFGHFMLENSKSVT